MAKVAVPRLRPRKEFEELLAESLEDKYKIHLPARVSLAALNSLDLSRQVEGNLAQQAERREQVNRYIQEHHVVHHMPHDTARAMDTGPPGPPGPPTVDTATNKWPTPSSLRRCRRRPPGAAL